MTTSTPKQLRREATALETQAVLLEAVHGLRHGQEAS